MPRPGFIVRYLPFLLTVFPVIPFWAQPPSRELTPSFVLTDTAAVARFKVSPFFKDKAPAAVRVSVDSLTNMTRGSFSVRLDMIINDKDSFQLGTFSPYPSDRPGNYLVSARTFLERISDSARSGRIEKAVLKFRLTAHKKNAGIRVHIRSVSWILR